MKRHINPHNRRRFFYLFFVLTLIFTMAGGCRNKKLEENGNAGRPENNDGSYAVGVLIAFDSPTSDEVFKAFVSTLDRYQKETGQKFEILTERAHGQLSILPQLARKLAEKAQILVPVSTPALQAVMIATEKTPVVFSSVANPYLVRAGRTAVDHEPRLTGVCSTAPVKQVLTVIRQVKPGVKKIGTVWTPSEVNSQYYLELMTEAADELGLTLINCPIDEAADLVQAFQYVMQHQAEVIFPVSDNTINANFDQLARLAEENRIPLFAAFALGAELGACASMGFGFAEIGKKTAELVVRIKNGESPALIPFQYPDKILFYINEEASKKQGIIWPRAMLKQADGIIRTTAREEGASSSRLRSIG